MTDTDPRPNRPRPAADALRTGVLVAVGFFAASTILDAVQGDERSGWDVLAAVLAGAVAGLVSYLRARRRAATR